MHDQPNQPTILFYFAVKSVSDIMKVGPASDFTHLPVCP